MPSPDINPWGLPLSILVIILIWSLFLMRSSSTRNKRQLPGPKPLPIIGNIHQISSHSKASLWRLFTTWKREYGPIFGASTGVNQLVILGDWETAHELLDCRAFNYSSRPRQPMANELVYKGNLHFLLRPQGDSARLHRRMVDRFFTPTAVKSYRHIHERESLRLLQHLLEATASTATGGDGGEFAHFEAFEAGITRFTSSVMYMLFYGLRIDTGTEHEVMKSKQANDNFLQAMTGFWLCDLFPFINHLPSFFPEFLTPWKRTAREWFEFQRAHHLEDLDTGRKAATNNLTKGFLGTKESKLMSETHLAYDLGVISDAGIDTTASTAMMFLLAAVAHPEPTRRAQREIDSVLLLQGQKRAPGYEDKLYLPYVDAFIKETMRWRPVIPGGIPHSNLEDDAYNHYPIPKASIVFPNVWSIHMDKRTYGEDAEFFRPERWLAADEEEEKKKLRDPVTFGFGRRVCIGQHVARDELFILAVRVLWAFEFEAVEKLDTMSMTESMLIRPKPFGFRMRPRGGLEESRARIVDEMMMRYATVAEAG